MQLNEIQSKYIKNKLDKLKKSKFRSSFHLTEKDKKYIETFFTFFSSSLSFNLSNFSPIYFLPF